MRTLLLPLLLALPALADRVVLTSGLELTGEILEESEGSIVLKMPNGSMTIPRARVKEIVREGKTDYCRREAAGRLRSGDTRTAVDLLERALREDAGNAAIPGELGDALLRHAEAERALRRREQALEALDRAAELLPGDPRGGRIAAAIEADERSAARLREEALALLEQGDYEAGLGKLNAWRLLLPAGDPGAREAMAAAHLAAGRSAAGEGRLREALDHLRTARTYGRIDEVDADLRLLAPIALLEAVASGDLEAARRLEEGLSGYPDPAVPLFLRAVISHVSGDLDGAVKGYADAARAAEEGPPANASAHLSFEVVRTWATATLREAIVRPPVEGAKRWQETFLAPLRRYESSFFVVYAPTDTLARDVGLVADATFESAARELLGKVPAVRRGQIVIHSDRAAYLAADPAPPGTPLRGAILPREETGGVTYQTVDAEGAALVRIETWADAPGLLADAIPHEVVHVVQRNGFPAFRRAHWLDEGLAMLGESEESLGSRRAFLLRAAALLPLPELFALRSTPPGKGVLFYAQASALTKFLRAYGTPAQWNSFLDALSRKEVDDALRFAFGFESPEALERLWLSSLSRG
jgi:tetratricopeptide (TPR) repeat protein